MTRVTTFTTSTTCVLVAAAVTAAASLAAPAAADVPAQVPNARLSDTLWPAPVGHLQPRRAKTPAAARQKEDTELSGERSFDRQLKICRDC
jgi:hypothetical protein